MSVVQFPGCRPAPLKASVDAILDELQTIEIELARARLAQLRSEVRQDTALFTWFCFKRVLFWGIALWLLTTCAKAEIEAILWG